MTRYGLINKSKLYIQTNTGLINQFNPKELHRSVDTYIKKADSSLFEKNVQPYFEAVEYF